MIYSVLSLALLLYTWQRKTQQLGFPGVYIVQVRFLTVVLHLKSCLVPLFSETGNVAFMLGGQPCSEGTCNAANHFGQ